ncbi:MAG TPA: glycosyltransferase family 2 protein [Anaerolineales bacterium]|nr:glycosyltransferase family 2 protein [Anaerolineales bacterium]
MNNNDAPKPDLTIVVPVYNEAESLTELLSTLVPTCRLHGWLLILINDGSRDGSDKILSTIETDPVVTILHHKVNRGYGGALKTGISAATTPYVITMDADGQHDISDILKLFALAQTKNADMVIGARTNTKNVSLYRELGKWLIRRITNILVPLPIRDLNSGLKLYQTKLVQRYLSLCPDSMAFSDVITLLFLNQRHLVLECEINIRHRTTGSSSVSTRTAFQTVIEILSVVMLLNPLRIFLPLSILCVTAGLLWGIPIILLGRGVSVGSMLAIVLGALFFFLGLIANQLSAIRLHLAGMSKNENPE